MSLVQVCHLRTAVPIFRPDLCPRHSCDVDTLPRCPQPLPRSHHLSVLGLLSLVLGLPSSPNSILAVALISPGRLSRFPAPHFLHGHVSNDLFFLLLQPPHPPTAVPQMLQPLKSPGAGLQPQAIHVLRVVLFKRPSQRASRLLRTHTSLTPTSSLSMNSLINLSLPA